MKLRAPEGFGLVGPSTPVYVPIATQRRLSLHSRIVRTRMAAGMAFPQAHLGLFAAHDGTTTPAPAE